MTNSPMILDDVTLICTLYNEAPGIRKFLDSIFDGSALPGELVIVDGGSTDGTQAIIEEVFQLRGGAIQARLIVDPTCSRRVCPGPVARGRNVAVRSATRRCTQ